MPLTHDIGVRIPYPLQRESARRCQMTPFFCFRASMRKFICSNRCSKQRKGGSPLADSLCEGPAASEGDGRDGASNSERSSQSMPLLIAEQMIFRILTRLGVTSRVYLRTATSGDCGTWSVMASPIPVPQQGVKKISTLRCLFFYICSATQFVSSTN